MPKAAITRVSSLAIEPTSSSKNNGLYAPILTTTQRNAIPANTLKNGAIIYNTTTVNFEVYKNGGWTTLTTNVNPNGPLKIPSFTTAGKPNPAAAGDVYYDTDTNQITSYQNGAWGVLYSTADLAGNLSAKAYANEGALPAAANGKIAYQTNVNKYRVGENNSWTTIFSTADPNGNLIVKSYANTGSLPDPAVSNGMIVYQNDIKQFKSAANDLWFILNQSTSENGFTTIASGAVDPTANGAPTFGKTNAVGTMYLNTTTQKLFVCHNGGGPGDWTQVGPA